MFYIQSSLEEWITKKYHESNVSTPDEIDIYQIADKYGIEIFRLPMPARYDICKGYKTIVLDNRCTLKIQYEQFFHELCHVLRHCGNQTNLPNDFRKLQEWEALRFTMYATIPLFMLSRYELNNPSIVFMLSEEFGVTEELCLRRLEQIKRNHFAFMFYE